MIQPNWYPDRKQLRQFAIISLVGFGVVGAIFRWRFGLEATSLVLWAAGVLTFLAGMVLPAAVLPVYTLLMAVTMPIGWLVSNVLLRLLYYGVFTPFGFVMKALGRDPLQLKRPSAGTYWLKHRQRKDPSSYYRQA